jgi:hypothetical protein
MHTAVSVEDGIERKLLGGSAAGMFGNEVERSDGLTTE